MKLDREAPLIVYLTGTEEALNDDLHVGLWELAMENYSDYIDFSSLGHGHKTRWMTAVDQCDVLINTTPNMDRNDPKNEWLCDELAYARSSGVMVIDYDESTGCETFYDMMADLEATILHHFPSFHGREKYLVMD